MIKKCGLNESNLEPVFQIKSKFAGVIGCASQIIDDDDCDDDSSYGNENDFEAIHNDIILNNLSP